MTWSFQNLFLEKDQCYIQDRPKIVSRDDWTRKCFREKSLIEENSHKWFWHEPFQEPS